MYKTSVMYFTPDSIGHRFGARARCVYCGELATDMHSSNYHMCGCKGAKEESELDNQLRDAQNKVHDIERKLEMHQQQRNHKVIDLEFKDTLFRSIQKLGLPHSYEDIDRMLKILNMEKKLSKNTDDDEHIGEICSI